MQGVVDFLTRFALGGETIYGPVTATNHTFEADVGHVVVTNGVSVMVYIWDDANANGERDAEEPCVTQRMIPNGHDGIITNTLQAFVFNYQIEEYDFGGYEPCVN